MTPFDQTGMKKSVGQAKTRLDGHAKVTGKAQYSADWPEKGMTFGVIFQSSIACGRIRSFDLELAKKVPGVIEILTHDNAPSIHIFNPMTKAFVGDPQLPLQSPKIYYNGQSIGVVVAETLEAAEQAARLVQVHYRIDEAQTDFEKLHDEKAKKKWIDSTMKRASESKGDVEKELKAASVLIQQTYTLPIENHHPMEPSATIAVFEGDELKVYDSTQGVANVHNILSAAFDVKKDKLQVITKFVGGGFGCKGSTWSHVFIAALAARKTKRPVKVVTSRTQMGTNVGYRASTIQDVVLGADEHGKLLAIQHHTVNPTSMVKDYTETTGALFKLLYDAKAIATSMKVVPLNYPTPTFMRAPGECSGAFALESAMDELAHQLKMDPLELRLKNYAEKDPMKDIPFSSKSLKECYAEASRKFGWDRRKMESKAVRKGDYYYGYGMATSSYPVNLFGASAKVELFANGTAKVTSATQDIGTGTYTVMTQLAADELGLPYDKVSFDLGDSKYPPAGVSGGSSTVSSVGWAIAEASRNTVLALMKLATEDKASALHGLKPDDLSSENGRIFETKNRNRSDTYADIFKRTGKPSVSAEGKMDSKTQKANAKKFSQHSYGAQFAEVKVHALTGEVTLVKMVGAFAAGKIVNPKTARSQFMGGMIFGIGMGLTEHNIVDARDGKFMARDLAEYHVPVNKDVPDLEIIMVDEKDSIVNPAGTKGIGEIGTVGTCAAIANAVFNATGIRIRDLPITPDKLAKEFHRLS